MKTAVLKLRKSRPETSKLRKAAEVLRCGGVIVLPTDTVYGLAANAFSAAAAKKIYRLKGRSFRKPLILMAPDAKSLGFLVEMTAQARALMKRYWPGPLTIVLPATNLGKLLMGGRANVGVRIPKDRTVLALLKLTGFPLATTSANPSGSDSSKDAATAARYFKGKVDVIIDCGKSKLGSESTVLDMTHFPFTVVRDGCLKKSEILKFI
jgi:L-threonylcarbamoyladenylate synthase